MARINKSLKEIAQELGTDKQTVYRLTLQEGISEAEIDGQRKLYDADAQRRIKQAYQARQDRYKAISAEAHQRRSEAEQKHINERYEAEIESLRERLADKDKEIERLHGETERLYTLANQAQMLQMQTEQRYQALLEVKDREQEQEQKQDEPQAQEQEHRSWWQRLFDV